MARLLVTGGAGFIGSNFVHHWLGRYPSDRIVVLDVLTYAGSLASLNSVRHRTELRFVHGDIGDTVLVESILRGEGIDTLVHFAAESHVDRSIQGPDVFITTNVSGTHSLLKAVRKVWLDEKKATHHRFHHVSTDEVYGSLDESDPPFTERTPYAPNSPYSATKAASDHLVRAYCHTYGLQITVSNCSNNYGPYHFPEKLIPLMIVSILDGKPLPIYGDGKNIRDWVHVSDHCRGIELVLKSDRVGEVYNIGGGAETENICLVLALCEIADESFQRDSALKVRFPNAPAASGKRSDSLISYVKDRLGHDRRYAIDCRKITGELGYQAEISIAAGLRSTFDWYLANESWWRPIIDDRRGL